MATLCNPILAQAPFETYRDPATGEWIVKQKLASKSLSVSNSNVISLAVKLNQKFG